MALQHVADSRLRDDKLVVYEALRCNPAAMHFAPPDVQQDRWLAMELVTRDGLALQHLSPEMQDDREIVETAILQNAWAFRFASANMRADRELIVSAVAAHARNLLYVSDQSLRGDRELILRCVSRNNWALNFAADILRLDRDFLVLAVEENPWSLPFAHAPHLDAPYRNTRDLVNAAAKQGASPSLVGRTRAWRDNISSSSSSPTKPNSSGGGMNRMSATKPPFGRGGHDALLSPEAAIDGAVIERDRLPPEGLVLDRGLRLCEPVLNERPPSPPKAGTMDNEAADDRADWRGGEEESMKGELLA